MDYELISQKQKNGSHLVKNKLTNEPVAILTKPKYAYKANAVKAEWHPDFKLLHPEVSDNLLHHNFEKDFDSVSTAVNVINGTSRPFVEGSNIEHDPIKTQYVGTEEGTDKYIGKITMHKWHTYDGDTHIGKMISHDSPNEIHRKSDVRMFWDENYIANNPISSAVKESAMKKHSGTNLESSMRRLRYMLDNREKEPRFIGTVKSSSSQMNVFKTKLNPEEASKAYEEHMKKTLGSNFTFTRHSPVVFSAYNPATGEYDNSHSHHVISIPGEIHHVMATTHHPSYQYGEKNTQVIESHDPNMIRINHKLLLEDHILFNTR